MVIKANKLPYFEGRHLATLNFREFGKSVEVLPHANDERLLFFFSNLHTDSSFEVGLPLSVRSAKTVKFCHENCSSGTTIKKSLLFFLRISKLCLLNTPQAKF